MTPQSRVSGGKLTDRNAIVYVVDERAFQLTRYAAASFILNSSGFSDLYIFCHNFKPGPEVDPLMEMGRGSNTSVHIEHIAQPEVEAMDVCGTFPTTAYLKLEAVRRIVSYYSRILYVDHDVLCLSDINVANLDFDQFPMAAVYDIAEVGGLTDPKFQENCFKNNLSLHYFNSGVMLFKCRDWDGELFLSKYMAYLRSHHAVCKYKKCCKTADQCAFNQLFSRNWKRLPLTCNMQACTKFTHAWRDASVRHYQGSAKFLPFRPWRNDPRDRIFLNVIGKQYADREIGFQKTNDQIFNLNCVRNRSKNRRVEAALRKVESMFDKNW